MSFTIRNKASNPILTFKPELLAKMLLVRPETFSLAFAKYRQDYKNLTGKQITLTYEQQEQLLRKFGADETTGNWKSKYATGSFTTYKLIKAFTDGFLLQITSNGFDEDLAVIEAFYDLLDMSELYKDHA